MSSLKDTVDKIKRLEAEKLSLSAEIEELKKMADDKANALSNEINSLRDDIKALKLLMGAEKQQQPSSDYLKEKNAVAVRELAGKSLGEVNKLGCQIFAVSPFSQYFDDWLINMRQIVSEFESNSAINVDEQFVKDRSQIFLDVEGALAQERLEESNIGGVAKSLADNNHLLVENDKEYAEKSRELSLKRDSEVGHLTDRVRELMREMESNQEDSKNKIFKKKTADKLAETKKDLQSAENELDVAQHNFNSEQDKLHEGYEKKKQDITGKVESLRKELEKLETDTSVEARQAASKALDNAINALVQRIPSNA